MAPHPALLPCLPTPHPHPHSSAAAAATGPGRGRLDEVLCILEVLASMSLAPAVADAALPPADCLAQVRAGAVAPGGQCLAAAACHLRARCAHGCMRSWVLNPAVPPHPALHCRPSQTVASLRARPEVRARGRERTHLLLLYSALCGCITCREPRVREMVKDVLLLAGAELGVGMPLLPPAASASAAAPPSRGASTSASASQAASQAASRRGSSVGEA